MGKGIWRSRALRNCRIDNLGTRECLTRGCACAIPQGKTATGGGNMVRQGEITDRACKRSSPSCPNRHGTRGAGVT